MTRSMTKSEMLHFLFICQQQQTTSSENDRGMLPSVRRKFRLFLRPFSYRCTCIATLSNNISVIKTGLLEIQSAFDPFLDHKDSHGYLTETYTYFFDRRQCM